MGIGLDSKKRKAGSEVVKVYPNMDMTVEEYLQYDVNESKKLILARAKAQCESLRQAVNDAKASFFSQLKENTADPVMESNDKPISRREGTRRRGKENKKAIVNIVYVCVATGPYKNQEYELQLEQEKKVVFGRSTGKRFKLPFGLSLAEDPEVSTTHAEISMKKDGTIIVRDLHSTNGTLFNGIDLDPNFPVEVDESKCFELQVGGSQLNIQIK